MFFGSLIRKPLKIRWDKPGLCFFDRASAWPSAHRTLILRGVIPLCSDAPAVVKYSITIPLSIAQSGHSIDFFNYTSYSGTKQQKNGVLYEIDLCSRPLQKRDGRLQMISIWGSIKILYGVSGNNLIMI